MVGHIPIDDILDELRRIYGEAMAKALDKEIMDEIESMETTDKGMVIGGYIKREHFSEKVNK
jgi:hypothetical protein